MYVYMYVSVCVCMYICMRYMVSIVTCIVFGMWYVWSFSMWCGICGMQYMHMNKCLLWLKIQQKGSSCSLHFLLVHNKPNKRHGRTICHAPFSVMHVTTGPTGAYLCGETHKGGEGLVQQEPWIPGSNVASSHSCVSPTAWRKVLQVSATPPGIFWVPVWPYFLICTALLLL